MGKELIIKAQVDDEKVELRLADHEVQAGLSVCHINNINKVFCLKGDKGSAMFFDQERKAMATQDQDGFEYLFTLDADLLHKHATKNKIPLNFLETEDEETEEPANTGEPAKK